MAASPTVEMEIGSNHVRSPGLPSSECYRLPVNKNLDIRSSLQAQWACVMES